MLMNLCENDVKLIRITPLRSRISLVLNGSSLDRFLSVQTAKTALIVQGVSIPVARVSIPLREFRLQEQGYRTMVRYRAVQQHNGIDASIGTRGLPLLTFGMVKGVRYWYRYRCFDTPSRGIDTPKQFQPKYLWKNGKVFQCYFRCPKTCLSPKMNIRPRIRHLDLLKR